jgi:hypothetical protein
MKRTAAIISSISKKARVTHSRVMSHQVTNYMNSDPLVDWLALNRVVPSTKSSISNFTADQREDFENKLMDYIKIKSQTVATSFTDKGCRTTRWLMEQGIPILYNAPVVSSKNVGGVIDLLVRSDYLSQIVDISPLTKAETTISAPLLGYEKNYHYVVVDIKFATLALRADGRHLLNSGEYPVYKARNWLYTEAVGEMQGYTSQYGLVLGKKWKFSQKGVDYSGSNCFERFGVIDYKGVDKTYIYRAEQAVNSWSDRKCTSSTLGHNGVYGKIITKILNINRQSHAKILPRKIKIGGWREDKGKYISDAYVTFETFSGVFSDINVPEYTESDMIYMIGLGWMEDGEWIYERLTCTHATREEEFRIMNAFNDRIDFLGNPKIWHWSNCSSVWYKSEARHIANAVKGKNVFREKVMTDRHINEWYDMSRIFREEPVVVKDCLTFKLNDIANALIKNKLIVFNPNNDVVSSHAFYAWHCYNSGVNVPVSSTMKNISKSTEWNCQVMQKILSYLRENH